MHVIVMRFISPEVVVLDDDGLSRRILRFYMLDDELVLDRDADECRPTKRHKWRVRQQWSRLDRRNNSMERRAVPQAAIDDALLQVRASISYRDE